MVLADPNPNPEHFPLFKEAFDKHKTSHHEDEAVGMAKAEAMMEYSLNYLDAIGQLDAFKDYDIKLDVSLKDRYDPTNTVSKRGRRVFDKITGVYPLPKDKRVSTEQSTTIPKSVADAIRENIDAVNEILERQFDELKKNPKIPKDKLKFTPKVFFKEGDADYLYIQDKDGEERVYKKIGKFLADKDDKALKQYREWKNTKKVTEAPDVKLVISTNPADIIRKSTGQWWESRSCEKLGGAYSRGIWDDISSNNAIAYVTVGDSPAWIGRLMLRWCEQEDVSNTKKAVENDFLGFGIEPVFYGDKSYDKLAKDVIKKLADEHDFMLYEDEDSVCKTPYVYEGWSDRMGTHDTAITYGNIVKSVEHEIYSIVSDWMGDEGVIIPYDYYDDDIHGLFIASDDLGEFIKVELTNFMSVYYEMFDGVPNDWEETVIHGYPLRVRLSDKSMVDGVLSFGDFNQFDQMNDDTKKVILWHSYTNESLIRNVFKILRKYKLHMVFYDNPDLSKFNSVFGEEIIGDYSHYSKYKIQAIPIKSGIYDLTFGVSDACLDNDECLLVFGTYKGNMYRESEFEKTVMFSDFVDEDGRLQRVKNIDGSPFMYDEAWFFRRYSHNFGNFYSCVKSMDFGYDYDEKKGKLVKNSISDKQNAHKCFEEHIRQIGSIHSSDLTKIDSQLSKFRRVEIKTVKKGLGRMESVENTIYGGTIPLSVLEDIPTFVKQHPDIDYDYLCEIANNPDVKDKLPKSVQSFCKIERPIEKFSDTLQTQDFSFVEV